MAEFSSTFDFGVNSVVAYCRGHAVEVSVRITVRELRVRFDVWIVVYVGLEWRRVRILGDKGNGEGCGE